MKDPQMVMDTCNEVRKALHVNQLGTAKHLLSLLHTIHNTTVDDLMHIPLCKLLTQLHKDIMRVEYLAKDTDEYTPQMDVTIFNCNEALLSLHRLAKMQSYVVGQLDDIAQRLFDKNNDVRFSKCAERETAHDDKAHNLIEQTGVDSQDITIPDPPKNPLHFESQSRCIDESGIDPATLPPTDLDSQTLRPYTGS